MKFFEVFKNNVDLVLHVLQLPGHHVRFVILILSDFNFQLLHLQPKQAMLLARWNRSTI